MDNQHHLVKLDYMDSENKLYKVFERNNVSKEFDFDRLDKYIEDNKKIIRFVQIGFSEDWGCSDIYFEQGYTRECYQYIPIRSSWASPTAMVVFYDGTEVTFSCYKYVTKFTLWGSITKGVSFIYEGIKYRCMKLLRMCHII